MPPVEAVVVDPGDRTVDLGQLTTSQRVTLEAVVDSLAGTGQDDAAMTSVALLLIVLGSILLVGSRRIGRGRARQRVRQQGGVASP
jgi:ABC-type Fe3+ transport system permease subunit